MFFVPLFASEIIDSTWGFVHCADRYAEKNNKDGIL